MQSRQIFVTGGTGFMGTRLIARLLGRGHRVRALARPGSESKLPPGCDVILGNALDDSTFISAVPGVDTYVHLVGVAHPRPAKAAEFRSIDLSAIQASVRAASAGMVPHFVYVSVAHPAPVMQDYIAVRREGERLIQQAGLNATILRPWYVLGPGHWWPVVLIPIYLLAELAPVTREGARLLGLVTLNQMVESLVHAVENPASGRRVVEAPDIRRGAA
jgi:uncharacterized protein YbjT (DUF2867 family)